MPADQFPRATRCDSVLSGVNVLSEYFGSSDGDGVQNYFKFLSLKILMLGLMFIDKSGCGDLKRVVCRLEDGRIDLFLFLVFGGPFSAPLSS